MRVLQTRFVILHLLVDSTASFDLVILNRKEEKLALIEFKAKNAHNHEHAKDFCKLMNPAEGENALRYFI